MNECESFGEKRVMVKKMIGGIISGQSSHPYGPFSRSTGMDLTKVFCGPSLGQRAVGTCMAENFRE